MLDILFLDFEVTLLLGQIGKEWREKIPQDVWRASMAKMHRKKMREIWDAEPARYWQWQMAGLEHVPPQELLHPSPYWEVETPMLVPLLPLCATRYELDVDQIIANISFPLETNGVRWEWVCISMSEFKVVIV